MAMAPPTAQAAVKSSETGKSSKTGESIGAGGTEQPWSSSPAAYYALTIIIIATFLSFFDQTVFGMLAQRIKVDFGLTDEELGILGGPASIIFYVFVGIPLARLVDLYPRKIILAINAVLIGSVTALGGIAQSFMQFFGTRMLLGAGGSTHAPASYSLITDMFPPIRIPRAFALLQLGFIGGTTLGTLFGGILIVMVSGWGPTSVLGLRIHDWQWILIWIGLPSIVVAICFLFIKEPPRRAAPAEPVHVPDGASFFRKVATFMGFDALKSIHAKRYVYYPLFFGLALSATESFGFSFWRVPFMVRTYGWNEEQIGTMLAPMLLVAQLIGLMLGGVVVERLSRKHKDANVRASAIFFTLVTVFTIAAPIMPNAPLSLACMAVATMFGLAGAPAQNAAIQRVAPQSMRGQVTAFYLFMFTFFGAMGSFVIGTVAQRVIGVESELWKAILLTAAILLPLASLSMWRAIKPYREEIERLEAAEAVAEAQGAGATLT